MKNSNQRSIYNGTFLLFVLFLFSSSFSTSAQIIIRYAGGTGTFGDGGLATLASVNDADGLVTDNQGNLFISDEFHFCIRRVDLLDHTINTFAGNVAGPGYVDGLGTAARFNHVHNIAYDGVNFYVADYDNYRIRRINAAGNVTTIAGSGIAGFGGDGLLATDPSCKLNFPYGIVVGPAGDIFFSDMVNNRIRRIDPAGVISTYAGDGFAAYGGDGGPATLASLHNPTGLYLDAAGNLYVCDNANDRVRVIDNTPAHNISTFAGDGVPAFWGDGGPANVARLNGPNDIKMDIHGDIFIADEGNFRVRKVDMSTPAHIISTFAGNGVSATTGDGGPATLAAIDGPDVLAFDCGGNLLVSDEYGSTVRKIIIDNPPAFVSGTTVTFNICQNAPAFNISSMLGIVDPDPGQIEAWVVQSPPVHGTLAGFVERNPSGTGTIFPTGLTYTPTAGFSGLDGFDVRIVDCGGLEDVIHVNVNVMAPPTAYTVTGGGPFCAGSHAVGLSNSQTGVSYQLKRGVTLVGPAVPGLTGSALAFGLQTIPGTYTVEATRTTPGCTNTNVMTGSVVINSLPAPITGPTTHLCPGGTKTLADVSIPGTWSTSVGSITSGGFFTAGSPGTATITFTQTSTGCSITRAEIVDPLPLPLTPSPSGSVVSCSGSAVISATGGSGGVVYFQGTTPGGTSTTMGGTPQTVSVSGTYYFREQSAGGCWGPDCAITVLLTAGATANAGLPQSVCAGGTVTLSGAIGGGASSATWTASSGTFSAAGSLTSDYTPSITSGTVVLTLTTNDPDGAGPCTAATSTVVITVDPLPASVTVSASTICGSSTLTATGGSGGVIYFQGTTSGGTSTVTPSTVQVVSTSGIFYFRSLSGAGCWGPQGSASVTITSGATASAGVPQSVCVGGTVTLAGTIGGGATSSTWSTTTSGVFSDVTLLTSTYTPSITSGSETLTLTTNDPDGAGPCPAAISTVVISINPPPISFTVTGGGFYCAGGAGLPVGLTGSTSGVSYQLYLGGTAVGSPVAGTGTGITFGTQTAAGVYTVEATNISTTCTRIMSGSVTITIGPALAAIVGPLTVCQSTTSVYTNPVPGGTWGSSTWGVAMINSFGVLTPYAPGTTTITYTTPCGVSSVVVTVLAAPPAITGPMFVCEGATVTLLNTMPGGTWTSSSTVASIIPGTGVATGVSGGIAVITYTATTGCFATRSLTVYHVEPITGIPEHPCAWGPTYTFYVNDATPGGLYSSGSVTTANLGGGLGGVVTYMPGPASITYTTSAGCYSTVHFTVYPLPMGYPIVAGGPYCFGGSYPIKLTSSQVGVDYKLYRGTTLLATLPGTGALLNFGLHSTVGTYTITATDNVTGCVSTMMGSIVINPVPEPITGYTLPICPGSTVALSSSTTGGTWSSSNTAVATVTPGAGLVTGVSGGSCTITYMLPGTGCYVTQNINILPPGPISGPSTVCTGASITLTTGYSGGTWSSLSSAFTVSSGGVVTGVSAGSGLVVYTVGLCSVSKLITVVASPAYISGPSNLCAGSSVSLTVPTMGGTWSSSDPAILSIWGTGSYGTYEICNISGASVGVATITYTMPSGCFSTISITVVAPPGPFSDVNLCPGCCFYVPDPGTGTWYSYDPSIATVTPITGYGIVCATTTTPSTVYMTYTSSITGCSTNFRVNIIYCGGLACKPGRLDTTTSIISPVLDEDEVSVHPNPAHDKITVSYPCTSSGQLAINIRDVSGRIRYTESVRCENGVKMEDVIDISTFASGVYFVELTVNEQHIVKKVVKL